MAPSGGGGCRGHRPTALRRGADRLRGIHLVFQEVVHRVFRQLAYSIRVGLTQSYARFNVAEQAEALGLIEALAAVPPVGPAP